MTYPREEESNILDLRPVKIVRKLYNRWPVCPGGYFGHTGLLLSCGNSRCFYSIPARRQLALTTVADEFVVRVPILYHLEPIVHLVFRKQARTISYA